MMGGVDTIEAKGVLSQRRLSPGVSDLLVNRRDLLTGDMSTSAPISSLVRERGGREGGGKGGREGERERGRG